MARNVFYSFHYDKDAWRASQVRNMGVVEGNVPARDNDWESVKRGGDAAIERWIDAQMSGRSCAVVLIGAETATRKWVKHEIKRAWELRKGVVGVYIHQLKDLNGATANKGVNPFNAFNISGTDFNRIVKTYDSPYYDSKQAYSYIYSNLASWIDEAIAIRARY